MPRDGGPARMRLRQAALDLYREHGYERTTTAQIAERAGVTERTYFRHFADKREVLFDGEEELRGILVGAIAGAPDGEPSLELTHRAFRAAVPLLVHNRAEALERLEVISQAPGLQERALAKSAALIGAIGAALEDRGTPAAQAQLAARIGMAAHELAASRWSSDDGEELEALLAESFAQVRRLIQE